MFLLSHIDLGLQEVTRRPIIDLPSVTIAKACNEQSRFVGNSGLPSRTTGSSATRFSGLRNGVCAAG